MSYFENCFSVNDKIPLFKYFNEKSSLSFQNIRSFERGIAQAFDDPAYSKHVEKSKKRTLKKERSILLVKQNYNNDMTNLFINRKSTREFSNEPIDLDTISKLLIWSYSITEKKHITIPSAGGIYEIKLLLVANNVRNLKKGIYLYDIHSTSLIPIVTKFNPENYINITSSYSLAKDCSFSIHAISEPKFTCYKYGDRGYRFLNLECGHIFQNLSLISNYYNVGSVCSGGFLEKDFIKYLNTNSDRDFSEYLVLYEMFFGNKKV